MSKSIAWYAQRYIERYNFSLVPIEPKRKFPLSNDWGNNVLSDTQSAADYYEKNPDYNMGLALGPSHMCSLDIDCDESFGVVLDEYGIDRSELSKYPTIQGRDKGRRLMFRVPAGADLPYQKLNWFSEQDPSGETHRAMMRDALTAKNEGRLDDEAKLRAAAKAFSKYTVFELRASTDGKQRQDVLPPSIHCDTLKPYKWLVQPPKTLEEWPEPPKWLLSMWSAWSSFKPQLEAASPWSIKPEPKTQQPRTQEQSGQGSSVIKAFIDAHDLPTMLAQYGYQQKGRERYLSPHSTTDLPGVVMFPDGQSCWVHHASDPLCSDDTGKPVNAFDLYCCYEHREDVSAAVKAAADLLGMKQERKRTESAIKTEAEPDREQQNPGAVAVESKPFKPFRALGYNGNSYYYLPRGTEQVSELKRGSHTAPAELMSLASIEWWEMAYPKKDKGGVDWHLAASDCMRSCEGRGIYAPDRERGRGAWYDKGAAVLHLGDKLLVDGSPVPISDHDSCYIYTRQAALEHGADSAPANNEQAALVADLFKQLNWSKPVHAKLLSGWCFLAPICGSLKWRPHVWITAQRGGGKSWIQDHIINPLLGPSGMMVQGSTTEAGIRQRLKQDARPIVFDEAESEDQRSQTRMQTVIELARQSSSDSTAEIIKGTVSGHGMAFRMRSMFMLGSVNVSLSQAADESRFSVLSLRTPEKTNEERERFEAFSKLVDNTLTDELCASLRARAYKLMPIIRLNAKTFSKAVAEILGSQRIGDQMGTLLAGDYAMHSDSEATIEQARSWVEGIDFSDAKEAEEASDEESCLNQILQCQVRVETNAGIMTRSIGELVNAASGEEGIYGLVQMEANDLLKRYGLSIEGRSLHVANNHAEIKRLLTGTPWGAGWRRILGRIEGAKPSPDVVRFAGTRSRAIQIPRGFIR